MHREINRGLLPRHLSASALTTAVAILIPISGCALSDLDMPDANVWKIPVHIVKKFTIETDNKATNDGMYSYNEATNDGMYSYNEATSKGMYSYVVNGKRYWVRSVAVGYRQAGLASWYGRKFHGRLTANQEVYNMHRLTAAHKSLPLPAYITVYNHNNGKRVTVRVNDRGPFVEGRIVDLSYAAAKKIDMVQSGIAPVTIEVIALPKPQDNPATVNYIQVGTYQNAENALHVVQRLRQHRLNPHISTVNTAKSHADQMHRVRLGPFQTHQELDTVGRLLEHNGFKDYQKLKRSF